MSRCPECRARPMWEDEASGFAKCAKCDRVYRLGDGPARPGEPAAAADPAANAPPAVRTASDRLRVRVVVADPGADDYRMKDAPTATHEVELPARPAPTGVRVANAFVGIVGVLVLFAGVAGDGGGWQVALFGAGLGAVSVFTLFRATRAAPLTARWTGTTLELSDGRRVNRVAELSRRSRVRVAGETLMVAIDVIGDDRTTIGELTLDEADAIERAFQAARRRPE